MFSRIIEYVKIRTVLQSSGDQTMSQVVVYKMPKIMENDINQSPQN